MYSVVVDGKVLDMRYKKMEHNHGYVFYVGDIYVGQIFKTRNRWCAVSSKPSNGLCPLDGFRSRYHASEFLLKFNKIGSYGEER